MPILRLNGEPLRDFSNPNMKVKWHKKDVYGDPVYGGVRTIAHLDWTSQQSVKAFGHEVEVLQGGFNTDVEASAGTHDFDGAIDYFIPGVDWWVQQKFFRAHGWADWFRYPPLFGYHNHGISLGCKGRVGIYVPGQIDDYYHHRTGLAGHAHDDSWHPANIDNTIFNFTRWVREQEDNVAYKDWPQADKAALLDDLKGPLAAEVVRQLLAEPLEADPTLTVKGALRQAQNAPGLVKRLARGLNVKIGD